MPVAASISLPISIPYSVVGIWSGRRLQRTRSVSSRAAPLLVSHNHNALANSLWPLSVGSQCQWLPPFRFLNRFPMLLLVFGVTPADSLSKQPRSPLCSSATATTPWEIPFGHCQWAQNASGCLHFTSCIDSLFRCWYFEWAATRADSLSSRAAQSAPTQRLGEFPLGVVSRLAMPVAASI